MRIFQAFIISILFINIHSSLAFSEQSIPLLDYWQEMITTCLDEPGTEAMVLDEGKIETPGYTRALNPGLVQWEDGYLVAIRSIIKPDNHVMNKEHYDLGDHIVLAKLDEDLKWVPGSDFILETNTHQPEDPRLYKIRDQLYVMYNDFCPEANKVLIHTAKINLETREIYDIQVKNFTDAWQEKNWVPFIGKMGLLRKLFYQYSFDPFKVYDDQGSLVVDDSYSSKRKSNHCKDWKSKWGEMRGGTPPIQIDTDSYLSFFHSSIYTTMNVYVDEHHSIYFMGAYIFSKKYPFKIKKMSKIPIFKSSFYDADLIDTTFPERAVAFPCGLCRTKYYNKDALIVTYGSNDSACKYVIFDTKMLLDSLKSID